MITCRACGGNLDEIYDFGDQPDCNHLLTKKELARKEPLILCQCFECHLVQLAPTSIPIFDQGYSFETQTNLFYLELLREWVRSLSISRVDSILEIGCNDGSLLKIFDEEGFIHLTGIDPISRLIEIARSKIPGAHLFSSFFDLQLARAFKGLKIQPKLIVINNAFAHLPNLNDFILGLELILHPEGRISIEVQDCENLNFENIYHEHIFYYDIESLSTVMSRYGFKLDHVQSIPTHGGSLRAEFVRGKPLSPHPIHYDWDHFRKTVKESLALFRDQIRSLENESTIFYGASAKGVSILNYSGITSRDVKYCLDDTRSKIGKFIPKADIEIVDHDFVKKLKPKNVVILNRNYYREMREKTAYISEWGGRHLCPMI